MDDARHHHGHIRLYSIFSVRANIAEHIGMETLRPEGKAEDAVLLLWE